MKQINKVVLVWGYGRANAGDHALTIGAIQLLRESGYRGKIVVVSRFASRLIPGDASDDIEARFDDVEVISSPFGFDRSTRLKRFLEMLSGITVASGAALAPRLFSRLWPKKRAIRECLDADVVVCNGGNLLYWNEHRRSVPRLVALLLPLLIARRTGVPYGFLPQTMGPFVGSMPRRLIGPILRHAKFVTFRDSISVSHANEISVLREDATKVLPDLAFVEGSVTDSESRKYKDVSDGSPFIAVTIRATRLGDPENAGTIGFDSELRRRTVAYLQEAVQGAIKEHPGLRLLIVQQTRVDADASHALARSFAQAGLDATVIEEYDPEVLSDLYSNAELLVGMRLHSLIFALRRGIPVVGVYMDHFGPKTPGILSDLGLRQYAVNCDVDPVDVCTNAIVEVLQNRANLHKVIQDRVDARVDGAKNFVASQLGVRGNYSPKLGNSAGI